MDNYNIYSSGYTSPEIKDNNSSKKISKNDKIENLINKIVARRFNNNSIEKLKSFLSLHDQRLVTFRSVISQIDKNLASKICNAIHPWSVGNLNASNAELLLRNCPVGTWI